MATFYLFDAFWPTIMDAPLVAVRKAEPMVPIPIGSNIPVRIDDSLHLEGSFKTLGELLALKADARLAQSGFGNIIYDDFVESPQIDPAEDEPIRYGDRGVVAVNSIAYVSTTTTALGSTPTIIKLEFDGWWIDYQADSAGKVQRVLTDVTNYPFPAGPLGNVYLDVDFGSGIYLVTQGEYEPIPISSQGNSFTLTFRNYDYAQWLYSGGWALMY